LIAATGTIAIVTLHTPEEKKPAIMAMTTITQP